MGLCITPLDCLDGSCIQTIDRTRYTCYRRPAMPTVIRVSGSNILHMHIPNPNSFPLQPLPKTPQTNFFLVENVPGRHPPHHSQPLALPPTLPPPPLQHPPQHPALPSTFFPPLPPPPDHPLQTFILPSLSHRVLPSSAFTTLQKHVFTTYFRLQTALLLLTTATHTAPSPSRSPLAIYCP